MEVHGVSEPGCFTPPDTPSPGGADPGLTALRLRRPPRQGRCRPLAAGGAERDGAAEERRPERGPELPLRAGSCEAGERRRRRRVPPCLSPALPPLPAATRPVRRPQTKGGSGDEPGQGGGGSPATAASFPAPEEPAERGGRRARRGLTRIRLKRLLSLGGSGTDGMMRAGGRGAARLEAGGAAVAARKGKEAGERKRRSPTRRGDGAAPGEWRRRLFNSLACTARPAGSPRAQRASAAPLRSCRGGLAARLTLQNGGRGLPPRMRTAAWRGVGGGWLWAASFPPSSPHSVRGWLGRGVLFFFFASF